ncbi:lariat debranching enzyme, C-terminal domain-containing protein [Xylaria sp. CBS 124048]|nr:lariat debranching enzyme, C-terminal domain-containing protein [Xylaria sp. CBS 124048]
MAKGNGKGKALERGVRVAVEGCGHGTLDAIYSAVRTASNAEGWDGVDLLIIGGDFQAVRNPADLNVMSVPEKYRNLGDFPAYYSGKKKAPYLTIFIGGNHEASAHLWELYYGGWVAPNIYYLGAANVLRFGPLRIAGMSGIYSEVDYPKSHYERLPFIPRDVKSAYHIRELDVRKLLLLREQVDVGLSHDWPRNIVKHGNGPDLFARKPFFRKESLDGRLGSPPAEQVMDRLRPAYWFSAHLHCKFAAIKKYDPPSAGDAAQGAAISPAEASTSTAQPEPPATANPDEIGLSDEEVGDDALAAETAAESSEVPPPALFEIPDDLAEVAAAENPDEIDIDDEEPVEETLDAEMAESSEQQVAPSEITEAQATTDPAELSTAEDPDDIDIDDQVQKLVDEKLRTVMVESSWLSTENFDEIDLGLDEDEQVEETRDITEAESSTQQPPQSAVLEALRAQLPASFAAPAAAPGQSGPKLAPGQPVPPTITNTTTRFLALDKCLPGRKFIQLSTLQPVNPNHLNLYPRIPQKRHGPKLPADANPGKRYVLQYDAEWLAITRVFSRYLTIGDRNATVPPDLGEAVYRPLIDAERAWVNENIVRMAKLAVPENFAITAPPWVEGQKRTVSWQPNEYTNPQTVAFCKLVDVPNLWHATREERAMRKEKEQPLPNPGGGRGGAWGGGAGHGGRGRGRGSMRGKGGGGAAGLARGYHRMATRLSRML